MRGMLPFTQGQDKNKFSLNFRGFLMVRIMEFDYAGKHYSYHGKKLENALNRLTVEGGPRKASTAELVVWGQASYDWKTMLEQRIPTPPELKDRPVGPEAAAREERLWVPKRKKK